MQPEEIEDQDEEVEDQFDNFEEEISAKAPSKKKLESKQASPQKKAAQHSSKKAVKKHESPRKGEVALLQESGKLSPLNPSRRAAEKAKKALLTSKPSVKANDTK